ncbi:hypothetical protein C7S13_7396 [Burkholderia cepacia]|nr:hypothetical protein [Burkholderia cepacia]
MSRAPSSPVTSAANVCIGAEGRDESGSNGMFDLFDHLNRIALC